MNLKSKLGVKNIIGIAVMAVIFVLIILGFFKINSARGYIFDYIYKPLLVYIPLIIILIYLIVFVVLKHKNKLNQLYKITAVFVAIIAVYYGAITIGTSNTLNVKTEQSQKIDKLTDIRTVFSEDFSELDIRDSLTVDDGYYLFGSYNRELHISHIVADSESLSFADTDVLYFSQPFTKLNGLSKHLISHFSDCKAKDLKSGKINDINYKYGLALDAKDKNNEFCYCAVIYNKDTVFYVNFDVRPDEIDELKFNADEYTVKLVKEAREEGII